MIVHGTIITDERVAEDAKVAGLDCWLFDYAAAICHGMTLKGHKIIGRGHEPRREACADDPFDRLLPHTHVHPPKKGAFVHLRHRRKKGRGDNFDRVRVVLEEHYGILHAALLACGYDLDTCRLLSREAYGAARLYWEMNHEPMPEEMATRLRALSEHELRDEDTDLFQRLKS